MPTFGLLADPGCYGIATDLYQLTMAAAYFENGKGEEPATFELFVRKLPRDRGYLLAAGLEQVVEYLQALSFSEECISYLRGLPQFGGVSDGFWDYLRELRFTGDVNAIPEGTAVFPNEPLIQVEAPLIQAQLVETFLLATLNHQTLIASKAARVVDAAAGKAAVEFGARRAHGFDAALYGARAAVVGGCIGTSNVLAGMQFGLSIYGTAAHSFTMAFPAEEQAFRAYQRVFPQHTTLLIDTYDTLEGARLVARLDVPVRGVRLDSGDLVELSRAVRRILDEAGKGDIQIMASGDLNEYKIAELLAAGAPIDLFGVGTDVITSRDAPALGGVYKLVAIADGPEGRRRPVRKLSQDKATYPEAKQVFRLRGEDGLLQGDTLALRGETLPGEPLLAPVLRGGRLVAELPSVRDLQERAARQRETLPAGVRKLQAPESYPIALSPGLQALIAAMDAERAGARP